MSELSDGKNVYLFRRRELSHQIIDMKCPGCGAPASTGETTCKYCHRPVIISTFNSVYQMPMPEVNKYARAYQQTLAQNPDSSELNSSVAMCYLKLGLHDKAIAAFEKALEDDFDNSEAFFYAAICQLRGKKAFLARRADIDKAVEYVNAALMIEPKGIYYYLLAYIKYDFFARKRLRTTPDYNEALAEARNAGLSAFDVEQLYLILGVEQPASLQ